MTRLLTGKIHFAAFELLSKLIRKNGLCTTSYDLSTALFFPQCIAMVCMLAALLACSLACCFA